MTKEQDHKLALYALYQCEAVPDTSAKWYCVYKPRICVSRYCGMQGIPALLKVAFRALRVCFRIHQS